MYTDLDRVRRHVRTQPLLFEPRMRMSIACPSSVFVTELSMPSPRSETSRSVISVDGGNEEVWTPLRVMVGLAREGGSRNAGNRLGLGALRLTNVRLS